MGVKHLSNLLSDTLHTLPILILYLTDGCNSRCVTCDIWRSPRRNMSMGLIESLAGECRALGVRWAVLTGGEAMQHPAWPEAARRLRAEGVHVMLLTNGLLLRRQIDDVLASVDEVIVSLDGGTAATYEAIRGVDGFDLVLEGVRLVRAGGLPVTTRTTVQRANYRELPQIVRAAVNADVSTISFLTVDVSNPFAFGDRQLGDSAFGARTNAHADDYTPDAALTIDDCETLAGVIDALETEFAAEFASRRIAESPAKLRRMVGYFRAVAGAGEFPPVRCNAPHTSVVVEVDGALRPCYFLPTMGRHTRAAPLSASINAPAARALRHDYRTGERAECARCVCPLYKGTRALLRM